VLPPERSKTKDDHHDEDDLGRRGWSHRDKRWSEINNSREAVPVKYPKLDAKSGN
jgi:hypothetical protein